MSNRQLLEGHFLTSCVHLGHVPLREKQENFSAGTPVQWQMQCHLLTHAHTNAHPLSVTYWQTHSPSLSFPLCLCSELTAVELSSPPPPHTPRIIEYRSLALPQCVSKCVCGRVCVWLRPSKVIAMATWAWGPLAVLSQVTGVTWNGGL